MERDSDGVHATLVSEGEFHVAILEICLFCLSFGKQQCFKCRNRAASTVIYPNQAVIFQNLM